MDALQVYKKNEEARKVFRENWFKTGGHDCNLPYYSKVRSTDGLESLISKAMLNPDKEERLKGLNFAVSIRCEPFLDHMYKHRDVVAENENFFLCCVSKRMPYLLLDAHGCRKIFCDSIKSSFADFIENDVSKQVFVDFIKKVIVMIIDVSFLLD